MLTKDSITRDSIDDKDAVVETRSMALNDIFHFTGGFGTYQKHMGMICAWVFVVAGMQTTLPLYTASSPRVVCTDAGRTNSTILCEALAVENRYCHVSSDLWQFETTTTSFVTDWGLYCDAQWKIGLLTSMFFIGFLIGNGTAGVLADRQGRVPVLHKASIVVLVFSILSAVSGSYTMYLLSRFGIGLGIGGLNMTSFILFSESVGDSYRSWCGTIQATAFGLGIMLGAVLAVLIPSWTGLTWFQSLPVVIVLWSWRWCHESPYWLVSVGHLDRANAIMNRIALINDVKNQEEYVFQIQSSHHHHHQSLEEEKRLGLVDLFTHPILRARSCRMAFIWLSVSFAYFGLSFNVKNLGSNLYVSSLLSGFSEMPIIWPTQLALEQYGRRFTLCTTLWIAASCYVCCILMHVPLECEEEGHVCWQKSTRLVASLIGKGSISGSFLVIFVFAGELYPTCVRSLALGFFSQCARIGSMMAPLAVWFGTTSRALPFVVFGVIVALAALSAQNLPETKGLPLFETIEDMTLIDFSQTSRAKTLTSQRIRCDSSSDLVSSSSEEENGLEVEIQLRDLPMPETTNADTLYI